MVFCSQRLSDGITSAHANLAELGDKPGQGISFEHQQIRPHRFGGEGVLIGGKQPH